MSARKRWARSLFQIVALTLVIWGVFQSIRQSSEQLGIQRTQLTEQAERLLSQSKLESDPREQRRLASEADRIAVSADRFWLASPTGLLLAGACYAVGMLPASFFWRRCLNALGQPNNLLDVLWAYFYGNLGKYFPGKAMVLVLRVAALEHHGIQKTATTVTIFMETLTMMSVGGATAAVCLLALNLDWRLSVLSASLLLATLLPTAPPVLRFLLPRLQKGVATETLQIWTQRLTWGLFARGWWMLLLTWLAFGLSLVLVLQSIPSSNFGQATQTTLLLSSLGACALAVVLGFVSLVPGGAGVREVVLSIVLTPVVGPVAAMCAAIWMRVVWLGTELAIVGILAGARLAARNSVRPHKVQV